MVVKRKGEAGKGNITIFDLDRFYVGIMPQYYYNDAQKTGKQKPQELKELFVYTALILEIVL